MLIILGKFPEKQTIVETTQQKILVGKSCKIKISDEKFPKILGMQGWKFSFLEIAESAVPFISGEFLQSKPEFFIIISLSHARHLVTWEAVKIRKRKKGRY